MYEFFNNGQMDRGNEKSNLSFALMIEENHKKPQSGWSAPFYYCYNDT